MSSAPITSDQAIEALRWWAQAGVEWTLEDAPRNRFDEIVAPKAPAAPAPLAARAPRASFLASPADEAVRAAEELASEAPSLDALRQAVAGFAGSALRSSATQSVFGEGPLGALVMFIADVPSADDDRAGRPFAGSEGRLLDNMLKAIGLDRTKVYLAQASPWRPPGNRALTAQETAIGTAFLRRQIALVAPRTIVCLGAAATQALLEVKEPFIRLRGRWRDFVALDGDPIKAMPMFSPGDLIRQPLQKRAAWQDLRLLAAFLASRES